MAAFSLPSRLSEAARRVEELKNGCCTTTRDCMFDDLIRFIRDIRVNLAKNARQQMTDQERKKIVRSGEVLGKLAVGCCRPERIKSYSECIIFLNGILFDSFSPPKKM